MYKLKESLFNNWKCSKVVDGSAFENVFKTSGKFEITKENGVNNGAIVKDEKKKDGWLRKFIEFLHHPLVKITILILFLTHIVVSYSVRKNLN